MEEKLGVVVCESWGEEKKEKRKKGDEGADHLGNVGRRKKKEKIRWGSPTTLGMRGKEKKK